MLRWGPHYGQRFSHKSEGEYTVFIFNQYAAGGWMPVSMWDCAERRKKYCQSIEGAVRVTTSADLSFSFATNRSVDLSFRSFWMLRYVGGIALTRPSKQR